MQNDESDGEAWGIVDEWRKDFVQAIKYERPEADIAAALAAERAEGAARSETLKQEAKIHAQEARTANSTVNEIYQLVTGATGEPGNWSGAEPVRKRLAQIEADAYQRGAADMAARCAEVARNKVYDAVESDSIGFGNNVAANEIANAILALSPQPDYASKLRAELAEKVKGLSITKAMSQDNEPRTAGAFRADVLAIIEGK